VELLPEGPASIATATALLAGLPVLPTQNVLEVRGTDQEPAYPPNLETALAALQSGEAKLHCPGERCASLPGLAQPTHVKCRWRGPQQTRRAPGEIGRLGAESTK